MSDIRPYSNIWMIRKMFLKLANFTPKNKQNQNISLLCSVNVWIGTHAMFLVIPKWGCLFLGSTKFTVRCYIWHVTLQTFMRNCLKIQQSWMLMLYFLYRTVFFCVLISDWYSMWLPLVCKKNDKDCLIHRCQLSVCFLVVMTIY